MTAASLPPDAAASPPPNAAVRPLPLTGVRVVEFTHMVMGPACGMILGDLGADVVKVEPPHGDKTRTLTGSGAGFFTTYNRNKRSLAVDLKQPEGAAIVRRLTRQADVVIENFRPDALTKLGLGYADLSADNAGLIYCSLKGFLSGPYEHRTALDEVAQMMGGLSYMTGPPGSPLRAGASVNDVMGGMFAAIAILAALRQRALDGRGQEVKSALFENTAFLMGQHMTQYALSGVPVKPMPARLSAWAIYDVFTTADHQQLFVAVVSDGQWRTFCRHFDLDAFLADRDLATNPQRVARRDRIMPVVSDLFRRHTKDELMAVCEALGLPFAPISRPEELFDDAHLNVGGGLLDVRLTDGRRTRVPALPLEIDGHRLGVRHDVPEIGGQSRDVLAELGYAPADIARLLADGVVLGHDDNQEHQP